MLPRHSFFTKEVRRLLQGGGNGFRVVPLIGAQQRLRASDCLELAVNEAAERASAVGFDLDKKSVRIGSFKMRKWEAIKVGGDTSAPCWGIYGAKNLRKSFWCATHRRSIMNR